MEGKRIKISGALELNFSLQNKESAKAIEAYLRNIKEYIEGEHDTVTYKQCHYFSSKGEVKITLLEVIFDTTNPELKNPSISEEERESLARKEVKNFFNTEVIRKFDT